MSSAKIGDLGEVAEAHSHIHISKSFGVVSLVGQDSIELCLYNKNFMKKKEFY